MAKYKEIINEIKEEETTGPVVCTELHKAVDTDEDEIVSLTVKVPRKLRQFWVIEARSRGTTLSAVIVSYLKQELGNGKID